MNVRFKVETSKRENDDETKPNQEPSVPYHLQGDESMSSDKLAAKRINLLGNPKVLKALDRFWKLFKFKDIKHGINREQYIRMHCMINKTMRDDFNMEMARGLAARDWAHDVKTARGLDKKSFRRSMFELADLWYTRAHITIMLFTRNVVGEGGGGANSPSYM